MITYPFTYANLKASINGRLHNKMGLIANPRVLINDVVSEVSNIGIRSTKRQVSLAPNLFNDIYQYAAPADIDGNMLVGIQPQSMNRDRNNIWELVTEEEFDVRKQTDFNLVAFADHTFLRTLKISARVSNVRESAIAGIQGLVGDSSIGDSWGGVGDATNLQTDTYNFIKGSGALEFDINAGLTTAGISLSTVNNFDLTAFNSAASVFTWAYLPDISGITNFKLRVGNSASNYYEMTAITPNDGTAFVIGWNLIRFDFSGKAIAGVVTNSNCTYISLFMTKTATKVAATGFRFNWLSAKQGQISNLIYYSAFPWASSTGVYANISFNDSDFIVCDQDEYNLFVEKGVEVLGMAAREPVDAKNAADRYGSIKNKTGMVWDYKLQYPTENMQLTSTYRYFGARDSNPDLSIVAPNNGQGINTPGVYS